MTPTGLHPESSTDNRIPNTEEEKTKKARKRAAPQPRPEDVAEQVWSDWLQLRKEKRAPVTETAIEGAREEAGKAGMTLEAFLRIWCRRGTQGLEAGWLKPHERGNGAPAAEPDWRREQRERNEQALGPYAAKRRDPNTVDMEAPNAVARLVG